MKGFGNRRFWSGLAIAVLFGTYVGATYSYPSFFGGGDRRIYPLLIWPSVAIGVVSGWTFILNYPVFHLCVAVMFFVRALMGRELSWDYTTFVAGLTFGGVADVVPYSFGWCCAGSLLGWCAMIIYRRVRGPSQASDATSGPAADAASSSHEG